MLPPRSEAYLMVNAWTQEKICSFTFFISISSCSIFRFLLNEFFVIVFGVVLLDLLNSIFATTPSEDQLGW